MSSRRGQLAGLRDPVQACREAQWGGGYGRPSDVKAPEASRNFAIAKWPFIEPSRAVS